MLISFEYKGNGNRSPMRLTVQPQSSWFRHQNSIQ